MKYIQKNFPLFTLILLTFSIYTPNFGVIEKNSIQYLLLSVTNFIAIFSIPMIYKEVEYKKVLMHPLSLSFLGYLAFSLVSLLSSINIVESFVRLGQLFTFYFSLLVVLFFAINKKLKIVDVLWILSFSLVIDMYFSLKAFYEILSLGIDYTYDFVNTLLGLAGNRNILAASILFRVPFVIILAITLNKNRVYVFSFLLSGIGFFNMFLLSSRAALLELIVSIFLVFLITFIYCLVSKKHFLKFNTRLVTLFLIPVLLAYYMSTISINSDDQADVSNRISTIVSTNDESKNARLRYYGHSIESIKANPLIGIGIGNWKIYSIKYDSKNIENFIVPYNAHNDVLEATAETGIFGGMFFLLFYLIIINMIIKLFKQTSISDTQILTYTLLTMPFVVYFIDLNLNFPSTRPLNLYLLLMLVGTILILQNESNEKA